MFLPTSPGTGTLVSLIMLEKRTALLHLVMVPGMTHHAVLTVPFTVVSVKELSSEMYLLAGVLETLSVFMLWQHCC